MEELNSLNSAKPSYFIASQRPRSLKYYLSGGLHHRLVGAFATRAFFLENISTARYGSASSASLSFGDYQTLASTAEEVRLPESDSAGKKSNLDKPVFRHDLRDKYNYSAQSDPGPIANYLHSENDPETIKEMVKLSNEVLASANTVFPLDLFPDSVVLDRTTLNITKRTFFFSNDTLSIRIEDILNAKVNVGPFLGSLTIASRVLSSEDHFTIDNLWRKDAIHLKHMIQGYIIALHNEIEISHLSKKELISTISELGHDLND